MKVSSNLDNIFECFYVIFRVLPFRERKILLVHSNFLNVLAVRNACFSLAGEARER